MATLRQKTLGGVMLRRGAASLVSKLEKRRRHGKCQNNVSTFAIDLYTICARPGTLVLTRSIELQ